MVVANLFHFRSFIRMFISDKLSFPDESREFGFGFEVRYIAINFYNHGLIFGSAHYDFSNILFSLFYIK